ncbi:MAG: hypothetical protein ABL891_06245 [Burkholderiales bacterium]
MSSAHQVKATPSARFVSSVAWSFIWLSAFTLLLAAIQYMLFAYAVPMAPLRAAFIDAIDVKLLPPSALTLLEHLPGICMALFAASLLTLLVSIALLKRKNWARITFAWIMIATALLHFAGLLLPFYIGHDVSNAINNMPPDVRSAAIIMTKMLSVISMAMGIVFGIAFAWIAKRLFAAEIAREFVTREAA